MLHKQEGALRTQTPQPCSREWSASLLNVWQRR